MRTSFLIIFALVFVSHFAWAQQPPPKGGERPNKEAMAEFKKSLDLSKEQKKEWKVIHQEFHKQAEAIRESSSDKKEQRMSLKKLREEKDAKLKVMLSEEQWAKYEAHKATQKEGRRPPRRG